jgi:GTPase SAR1 family protein
MLSKWIYVLVGNNNTGKSTFQKRLLYHLTDIDYQRLDRNLWFEIRHHHAPKKMRRLFVMGRSFQENQRDYESVEKYFERYFECADVCILSSHAHDDNVDDIKNMIIEGRKRKYNLGGVFWSNSSDEVSATISLLDWDERFYLENPVVDEEEEETWRKQIDDLAWEFAEMLIRRATVQ